MRWNFWMVVVAVAGSMLVASENESLAGWRHRRCGGGGCRTSYSACGQGGCTSGGCASGGCNTGYINSAPAPTGQNGVSAPAPPAPPKAGSDSPSTAAPKPTGA